MKKEGRAGHTTLGAIAIFKGGGFKRLSIEIGRLPLRGAAYFFMGELSDAIMNMPNMNNRDYE